MPAFQTAGELKNKTMLNIEEVKKKLQEATEYALNAIKNSPAYKFLKLKEVIYFTPRPYKADGVHAIFGDKGDNQVPLFNFKQTYESLEITFSAEVNKAVFEEALKKNVATKPAKNKTKKPV